MRPIELEWIGGADGFLLDLPRLEALEDRLDGDGIGLIRKRLLASEFKALDVVATLSLALEGGGMEKRDAVRKVRTLWDDHGSDKLAITAINVLCYAMQGWPDDDLGEEGVETPKASS